MTNENRLGLTERVVHIGNRHFIMLVRLAANWALLFLGSFIGLLWLSMGWNVVEGDWHIWLKGSALVFLLILYLLSAGQIFLSYQNWQSQEFIITSERIINLEGLESPFFQNYNLEDMEEVKLSQSPFGKLLGYGTIVLSSKENGSKISLYEIRRPAVFLNAIVGAKEGNFENIFDSRFKRNISQLYNKSTEVVDTTDNEYVYELPATDKPTGHILEVEKHSKVAGSRLWEDLVHLRNKKVMTDEESQSTKTPTVQG